MSRRDTIIIAVLVNAGLLMVLFATAMRSDKKPSAPSMPLAEVTPAISEQQLVNPSPFVEGEQIDNLLDQYAAVPTISDAPLEEILFSNELAPSFLTEESLPIGPSSVVTPIASLPSPSPHPIPSPAPQVPHVPQVLSITVKKGDVLEKIARANGSSVNAIMKANNLSSTQLKIGQVLKVPSKEGATSSKKESSSSEGEYYTVKDGDSPWLIASRNNIKLDELLRLNKLDEQKARKLRPGDRLRIR